MEPPSSHELQIALGDLQRYLQDQIPPLTASDALETLMAAPPELLMKHVHHWSSEQARFNDATQGDLLYHAIRKIHFVAMLKLIDRSAMEAYLERVYPLALQICPAEERELLRDSLAALRDSVMVDVSTVVPISRGDAGKPAAKGGVRGTVTEAVARSTRRLSMIVERLARHIPFAGGSEQPAAAPSVEPQPRGATGVHGRGERHVRG